MLKYMYIVSMEVLKPKSELFIGKGDGAYKVSEPFIYCLAHFTSGSRGRGRTRPPPP